MFDVLFDYFKIYGDEESSYECADVFKKIISELEDIETTLQVVINYLIETTDFSKWIENVIESMGEEECDGNCFNCNYDTDCDSDEKTENEQVDLFNAQAELLEKTQEIIYGEDYE